MNGRRRKGRKQEKCDDNKVMQDPIIRDSVLLGPGMVRYLFCIMVQWSGTTPGYTLYA
jgi:hypothetical protein